MKNNVFRKILNSWLIITSVLGEFFLIMLIFALTPAPFYMHYKLGTDPNKTEENFIPKYIVMLGGGGMPSEGNLMRLFYTAEYANYYNVPVIILHPEDSITQTKMAIELINKGIDNDSIMFFTEGANTRAQILNLKINYPEFIDAELLVITSPEHLKRTIKCFNKLEFQNICGQAAFDAVINFDLSIKDQELLGKKYVPEVNNTNIRYTFWNYLKLEITCFREYFALMYYKLKGWI